METRRLQATGGASFSITLPKRWVEARGLGKNGIVTVADGPEGELVLRAGNQGTRVGHRTFGSEDFPDGESLFRMLSAAYVSGNSKIVVESAGRTEKEFIDAVSRFNSFAIGFQVVDQDLNSITLADVLAPAMMEPEKTLGRMFLLVRSMLEDCRGGLSGGGPETGAMLSGREEVSRLAAFLGRVANVSAGGQLSSEFIFLGSLGRGLERIAGIAAELWLDLEILVAKKAGGSVVGEIGTAIGVIVEILAKIVDAWVRGDLAAADGIPGALSCLGLSRGRITDSATAGRRLPLVPVAGIERAIGRAGEECLRLSETLMCRLV